MSQYTYSLDGKKESKAFLRQPDEKLKKLYRAHIRSNNFPVIRKLSGKDIEKLISSIQYEYILILMFFFDKNDLNHYK